MSEIGNINGKADYTRFGFSVSLSNEGNYIAIGAPFYTRIYSGGTRYPNAGLVRVYQKTTNSIMK